LTVVGPKRKKKEKRKKKKSAWKRGKAEIILWLSLPSKGQSHLSGSAGKAFLQAQGDWEKHLGKSERGVDKYFQFILLVANQT